MWPFVLWTEPELKTRVPPGCIEEEFAHVSDALGLSPPLRVVRCVIQPIPTPLRYTNGEDVIDWDALSRMLKADQTPGHVIMVNSPEDQYLADANRRAVRIGLNLHWILKHVVGDELARVMRAIVRHELGHILLGISRREWFQDDSLNSLELSGDWLDPRTEEQFDGRLGELEGPSEDRLVGSFGYHCLRNNCIMRQRTSRLSHLGFIEIADCNYCEICRSCVDPPRFSD